MFRSKFQLSSKRVAADSGSNSFHEKFLVSILYSALFNVLVAKNMASNH